MKRWILVAAIALVIGLGATVLTVKLSKPTVDLKDGAAIWIEGNSSLKRFYLNATRVSIENEMDNSDSKLKTLTSLILNKKGRKLTVNIPVEGLKSGDPNMDQSAYEKLKFKNFPDIVFTMGDYVVKAYPGSHTTYALLVSGKLKIAGVEREVVLEPTMVIGLGGIKIYGSQDVYQKDYGIAPYSVALVMTADNKIVVHYMAELGAEVIKKFKRP